MKIFPRFPLVLLATLAANRAPIWLPSGQTIVPWGRLLAVGTLPESLVVSPDGHLAAVSDDGTLPDVRIVNLDQDRVVQTLAVKAPFVGLAWDAAGERLAVSDGGQNKVLVFERHGDRLLGPPQAFAVDGYPAGLAFGPAGTLYAASSLGGDLAEITPAPGTNLGPGILDAKAKVRYRMVGALPFAVAEAKFGEIVCNRNEASVTILDPRGRVRATVAVGQQPCAVAVRGDRAYVSNAGSDTVSVLDVATATVLGTWPTRAWKGAPLGAMPTAIAIAGPRLYVALSGINAVAVLDRATGKELFRIPTAWYPSAIAVAGKNLLIACAKGLGSGPSDRNLQADRQMPGVLEWGPVPEGTPRPRWRAEIAPPPHSPLPRVAHVVFVMKENRTYDQDLGDWPGGNGDARLADFGAMVTPNTHALARQFATSDQYYAAGEVSAQGHEWLLGGLCSDYVERVWPTYEDGRGHPYDAELPQGEPPAGMILENCIRHGISARMYGAELTRGADLAVLPMLKDAYDPAYTGWNLHVPDSERIDQWEAEFKKGVFPRFEFIWLPSDHTAGFAPGFRSPRAMVADNDQALGRLVGDLSHAPTWPDTVVFVAEDDAQGGQDHVDAHRSVMLAIGPWIRHGYLEPLAFSQPALLHTVLALLSLPPLTAEVAAAPVLTDFFASKRVLTPYDPIPARISTDTMNPLKGLWAKESADIDLSRPDVDAGDMARMLAERRLTSAMAWSPGTGM